MLESRLRGRARVASAVALLCASAVACDSVLDIEDPMTRPADGGEPSTGGTESGTAGSTTTPEGGGAGEGGSSGAAGGAGGTDSVMAGAGSGGEGGDPLLIPKDCETDSVRCTDKVPEVCDSSGHWVPNPAEADGECAVLCSEGRCVECLPDEKRCAACEEGDASCNPNQPQTCEDGEWKNAAGCKHYCDDGECVTPRSCEDGPRTTCQGGLSCCTSLAIPGGSFARDYDGGPDYSDDSFKATITPFYLDKFEVTVGRMRQFVAKYPVPLEKGQGKAPHIADDEGWAPELPLPADTSALVEMLKCQGQPGTTWDDLSSLNNNLPVNCVSFAVAYAFCVWDGGRLPTEAEWNFAAAGGAEQRAYPWFKDTAASVSTEYANYNSEGPLPPGSKPKGDGRWGHSDLAGNVYEWNLDFYGDYPITCNDCLNTFVSQERVMRGGSYNTDEYLAQVPVRSAISSTGTRPYVGFRCARDFNPGDN